MLQHFMQKRRFVPLVSLVFFILRFHVGCCGCEPKGEPPTSWYLCGLPGRIWSLRAGRMLILRRRIYYHKHTASPFMYGTTHEAHKSRICLPVWDCSRPWLACHSTGGRHYHCVVDAGDETSRLVPWAPIITAGPCHLPPRPKGVG